MLPTIGLEGIAFDIDDLGPVIGVHVRNEASRCFGTIEKYIFQFL